MREHKCKDNERRLDLICRGCLKKIMLHKEKLIEFVKEISIDPPDRCDPSEECIREEARALLKDIGEL